jgi:hypothetical protein
MQFVIRKNTWHYKYYCLIKNLWGGEVKDNTSLCPYFHTMFWGTFFTFFFTITLVLPAGWLWMKLNRIAYKVFMAIPVFKKVTEWMDGKFNWGYGIESLSEELESHPVGTMFFSFLTLIGFLCVVSCITVVASFGVWGTLLLIPKIPYLIMWAFIWLGFLIYFICACIGFLVFLVIFALQWLVSPVILKFIMLMLIVLTLFAVVGYLLIKLFSLPVIKDQLYNWFVFKFNGFQEARKVSFEEAVNRRDRKIQQKYKRSVAPNKFLSWVGGFFRKNIRVKDRTVVALGLFSAFWELLKGMKEGVCPTLEFINEEDIKK